MTYKEIRRMEFSEYFYHKCLEFLQSNDPAAWAATTENFEIYKDILDIQETLKNGRASRD